MRCVITAGPTFEPLDGVRRLTNFSTGRLGLELADYLLARRHEVRLLLGENASAKTLASDPSVVVGFTTTEDLSERLRHLAEWNPDAVYHAAAVSDFRFGRVWRQDEEGRRVEIESAKITTRHKRLLAELVATPKIIERLRGWFPTACLVGWKYELVGQRHEALQAGHQQIARCQTNGCVVNGRAYGEGFGLVRSSSPNAHFDSRPDLFGALERLASDAAGRTHI